MTKHWIQERPGTRCVFVLIARPGDRTDASNARPRSQAISTGAHRMRQRLGGRSRWSGRHILHRVHDAEEYIVFRIEVRLCRIDAHGRFRCSKLRRFIQASNCSMSDVSRSAYPNGLVDASKNQRTTRFFSLMYSVTALCSPVIHPAMAMTSVKFPAYGGGLKLLHVTSADGLGFIEGRLQPAHGWICGSMVHQSCCSLRRPRRL